MKIRFIGKELSNWSLDDDYKNTKKIIEKLGHNVTNNYINLDIIWILNWTSISSPFKLLLLNIHRYFFKTKVVLVLSNDPSYQLNRFVKICSLIDIFICSNKNQVELLKKVGINKNKIYNLPYFIDTNTFKDLNQSKQKLAEYLKIDLDRIKNKLIIGSFQRDSLAENLNMPKWQKNPDLFFNIVNKIKKDKIILLAGPRRHYLVNKLRKENIEYIFFGDEQYIDDMKDDISVNIIDKKTLNILYNIIDLYIVSSKSEGGPKAILECGLSKTNIISTDVGLASDYLPLTMIYNNEEEALSIIDNLSTNYKKNEHLQTLLKKLFDEDYFKVIHNIILALS